MRIEWSYIDDPTMLGCNRRVYSAWCPRWLQPLALRALRWLGARVL